MGDDRMVKIACNALIEYFSDGRIAEPADLEEDFFGKVDIRSMINGAVPAWHKSPFCIALGRLVDAGLIIAKQGDGSWSYQKSGKIS